MADTEAMARRLCEIRHIDPDGRSGVLAIRERSRATTLLDSAFNWEVAEREVVAFRQVAEAVRDQMNESLQQGCP